MEARSFSRVLLTSQVVILILLGACSSPSALSRDKAAVLIGKSSQFLAMSYAAVNIADAQQLAEGVSEGWWLAQWSPIKSQASGAINITHFELTPQGKQFFAGAEVRFDHVRRLDQVRLDLKDPVKPEIVEVTGISDAPLAGDVKEVRYRWRYAAVPAPLQKLGIVKSGQSDGRAILRLYDDAWRVEQQ